MSFCCECCMLSGRGFCDGLIIHREARRCVWSRNLVNEEAVAHRGAVAPKRKKLHIMCMSLALVTKHAVRMRRIVLSSVVYLAISYFSHYILTLIVLMWRIGWANSGLADGMFLWPCISDTII